MQSLDTGYKSEFGLGAALAGQNDAYAEEENKLNLVKAFLANQREQQMQPLDVDIKGLQAAQSRMQNTPEMLQGFVDNARAGYNKNIREDELGNIMQPFRKQQAPLQGQRDVDYARVDAEIARMQDVLRSGISDNGLPLSSELQDDLSIRLQELTARRGNTPEHWGKINTENVKGQWGIDKQALANKGSAAVAQKNSEKQGQAELVRVFGQIRSEISNIDTNLTKLETKEIENQFLADFLARGKGSKEAAALAKVEVSRLKQQLLAKKQELETYQRQIITQIPGMSTVNTPPTAPATKTENWVRRDGKLVKE